MWTRSGRTWVYCEEDVVYEGEGDEDGVDGHSLVDMTRNLKARGRHHRSRFDDHSPVGLTKNLKASGRHHRSRPRTMENGE